MHNFFLFIGGLTLGIGTGYAIHNNRTWSAVFALAGVVFLALWHFGR